MFRFAHLILAATILVGPMAPGQETPLCKERRPEPVPVVVGFLNSEVAFMAWDGTLNSGRLPAELVEDIRAALLAVENQNYGTTAPTRAGALWADSATARERQRNQANSAWMDLWAIDSRPFAILPKVVNTATYTVDPLTDSYLIVDASAAPVQITMPDIDTVKRQRFVIVKGDATANAVTIVAFAGDYLVFNNVPSLVLRRTSDYLALWNDSDSLGPVWMIEGDMAPSVRTLAADGNPQADDELVLLNATSASVQYTLPTPYLWMRRELTVKKIAGGNAATVYPGASRQIDNLGNGVAVTLASVNDRIRLRSDGAQWWRVD